MSRLKIASIGVYGYTERTFFAALRKNRVAILCDVRRRRAVRGRQYAFANSRRLQEKLKRMGIRYIHAIELAPSNEIRQLQKQADVGVHTQKKNRLNLAPAFAKAYVAECLTGFNPIAFFERHDIHSGTVAFLCVEHEPEACHRSLITGKIHYDLGIKISHIH